MDAVLTAVEAKQGASTLATHDEAVKQVLLVDDIILTKMDLADEPTRAGILAGIAALKPGARVARADNGALDWRPLLQWTTATLRSRLDVTEHEACHPAGVAAAFAVRTGKVVDFEAFALWLFVVTQMFGDRLLRVKGLFRGADAAGPIVVQAVQHVVYPPFTLPAWPSTDHATRLVVITRGMAPPLLAHLKSSLDALLGLEVS